MNLYFCTWLHHICTDIQRKVTNNPLFSSFTAQTLWKHILNSKHIPVVQVSEWISIKMLLMLEMSMKSKQAKLYHNKKSHAAPKTTQKPLLLCNKTSLSVFPKCMEVAVITTVRLHKVQEFGYAEARKISRQFTVMRAPVSCLHCLVAGFFILSRTRCRSWIMSL